MNYWECKVIHCMRPAKSGCAYRWGKTSGAVYWVSCPKRGSLRAWKARVVFRPRSGWVRVWDSVPPGEACEQLEWYVYDERNPKFAALLRDWVAFKRANRQFGVAA